MFALPTEIITKVNDHLDILDVWKLRRVSKKWQDTLSSDAVVKPALNRWNTHCPSDSARENPDTSSPNAQARRIGTMRSGAPSKSRTLLTQHRVRPQTVSRQESRVFALKGRRIAYIDETDSLAAGVVVRDLVSNEQKRYTTTARETVCAIALSSKILAFWNFQGILYVQSLTSLNSAKRSQLPSSSYAAFAADEDLCVVVFNSTSGAHGSVFSVALYDHGTREVKGFDLPCALVEGSEEQDQEYVAPTVALLNAKEKVLDLFSSWNRQVDAATSTHNIRVEHRRCSFDGQELHASHYQRDGVVFTQPQPFLRSDLYPTGEKDIFLFRTVTMGVVEPGNTAHKFSFGLCFNSAKAQLEERYFLGKGFPGVFGTSAQAHLNAWRGGVPSDFWLWKGIKISAIGPNLVFKTEMEDVTNLSSSDEERWVAQRNYRLTQAGLSLGGASNEHALYANDSFVVAVAQTPDDEAREIHVLCFDEELPLLGA